MAFSIFTTLVPVAILILMRVSLESVGALLAASSLASRLTTVRLDIDYKRLSSQQLIMSTDDATKVSAYRIYYG